MLSPFPPPHFSFLICGPRLGINSSDVIDPFNPNISTEADGAPHTNPLHEIHVEESYCYQKNALSLDFEKTAECLASRYYVWGFSSVILYILLSLQFVWTLEMFIIWLDANIYSQLCRKRRTMSNIFSKRFGFCGRYQRIARRWSLCVFESWNSATTGQVWIWFAILQHQRYR